MRRQTRAIFLSQITSPTALKFPVEMISAGAPAAGILTIADKPGGSSFIDYHEWQGRRDLAAFLSVPAAIDFQEQHDWETVRTLTRPCPGDKAPRARADGARADLPGIGRLV